MPDQQSEVASAFSRKPGSTYRSIPAILLPLPKHLSRGVPTGWENRFQLQDLLIQSLIQAAKQPANWSRIDDLAKDFL